jgi:cytochrome c peroxidase
MKLIPFLIIVATTISLSWYSVPNNEVAPAAAMEELTAIYKSHLSQFQHEVSKLADMTSQALHQIDRPLLQQQMINTRLAYKRIEFLFDFHKTDYNYIFVNGPPLPKVDENFSPSGLTPPNGLQTLDELIFGEELVPEWKQVQQLAADLKENIDKIMGTHQHIKLTEQSTMQALRSGIVRLFALGVTGFDTPGAGNALEEAIVSLKAMEEAFTTFKDKLKPEGQTLFEEITRCFQLGQSMLQSNPNFDTFDRLTFLKEVINPLYAKIFQFQVANELPYGGFKFNAQNFRSENLFDEDFLNLDFYSNSAFIPLGNPAAIQLGKQLFFDPILSKDVNMSCATCHDPKKAFTDGLPKSKSNTVHTFTRRNAPTLIDAAFSTRFFYDLREYDLEQQVAHVVTDSLEFNISFTEIAERLSKSPVYRKQFEDLYGSVTKNPLKRRSISNPIAAYVNSLISFDSAFDKYVREESSEYPEAARRGFNLFMGKAACGTCHFVPTFSGLVPPFYMETESEVLGITLGLDTLNPQMDMDLGRRLNGKKKEAFDHFRHSMKTVTVRNTALTAPYMHNGLFNTLEEVIEFYDHGGGAGMGLDIDNQTLSSDRLNLSKQEKSDLIAFMHTLTDTTGLTDAKVLLPKIEGHPDWDDRGKY